VGGSVEREEGAGERDVVAWARCGHCLVFIGSAVVVVGVWFGVVDIGR
jgi:hypothetical protein